MLRRFDLCLEQEDRRACPTAASFDPKAFLDKVGAGKRILNIPKGRHIFFHGDAADTVFYLQTEDGSSSNLIPDLRTTLSTISVFVTGQWCRQGGAQLDQQPPLDWVAAAVEVGGGGSRLRARAGA